MDGPLSPVPAAGKEDSANRRGLLVNTDTSRTQVWTARNRWEDRDTPAARQAGLAWGADSGLTWDEKYARWILSMERTASVGGDDTFLLTTPWGKSLPSPSLECAELSIFLRITFAAWYELPFFLEAVDSNGQRVFFGHNGVRTANGRYASTPEYAIQYADHSGQPPADVRDWPRDEALRRRLLAGGVDEQPMLGEGATFGTYADEIHLNKRAGHFLLLALNYIGSANLADTANTYNIVPEAVRAGDSLLERWQRVGIGHTLVVKEVTALGEGNLDVALVSGSMPRRQGVWESGVRSKQYFTDERTGGEGENSDGDRYAALGGGLKRWRVTKNIDGYWTNTWMQADEAHWINCTDLARIAARPARFEQLLGQISPEDARDGLLVEHRGRSPAPAQLPGLVRGARAARARVRRALRSHGARVRHRAGRGRPAVPQRGGLCLRRAGVHGVQDLLLELVDQRDVPDRRRPGRGREGRGRGRGGVPGADRVHEPVRRLPALAPVRGRQRARRPVGGVERGRGLPAARRGVRSRGRPRRDGLLRLAGPRRAAQTGCTDALEPNNGQAQAASASGSQDDLAICAGDSDWFAVSGGGEVGIEFSHAGGDLDMAAFDANGAQVAASGSTSDSESVAVPAGGAVRVYGYASATNSYRIVLP